MGYNRILIFNPFGIGDVLFVTPLIRNLREFFPDSYIAFLGNRRVYDLMIDNPLINRVYIYEKDEWRKLWKTSKKDFFKRFMSFYNLLRKENFDLIFDLSLNSQYHNFFRFIGIPTRVGYNFRNRGRSLTHKIRLGNEGYCDKHMVEYYLALLGLIGLSPKKYNMECYFNRDVYKEIEHIIDLATFKDKVLVGVIPGGGASWGKDAYKKRWPKEYFISLIRELQKKDVVIAIFGSLSEKELCSEIAGCVGNNVLNFAGMLSLQQFCAFLSLSKLLITNDGGPLHLAVSLGVNTISLFGPVNEQVYGPYYLGSDKSHIVITKDVKCRPCYQRFRMPECHNAMECLRGLKVERVLSAVDELLNKLSDENIPSFLENTS